MPSFCPCSLHLPEINYRYDHILKELLIQSWTEYNSFTPSLVPLSNMQLDNRSYNFCSLQGICLLSDSWPQDDSCLWLVQVQREAVGRWPDTRHVEVATGNGSFFVFQCPFPPLTSARPHASHLCCTFHAPTPWLWACVTLLLFFCLESLSLVCSLSQSFPVLTQFIRLFLRITQSLFFF